MWVSDEVTVLTMEPVTGVLWVYPKAKKSEVYLEAGWAGAKGHSSELDSAHSSGAAKALASEYRSVEGWVCPSGPVWGVASAEMMGVTSDLE